MKLSHNGEEWHGTFGLAVEFVARDLLTDAPFKARIDLVDSGTVVTGSVTEVKDFVLTVALGTIEGLPVVTYADESHRIVHLPIDDVMTFEVL